MSEIPCKKDPKLGKRIEELSEILKTRAHELEDFGLSEADFYESGVFDGAIERVRGQRSATMKEKKAFVQHILNHMEDKGFISGWEEAGGKNRHDYSVELINGKIAAIELKGCLDGNNTNISARPPHADEFIVWSVCQNKASDPRKGIWSGLHTRTSADIISEGKRIDGFVVWDWLCGSPSRPCPKLAGAAGRVIDLGPYRLPPPCIYLFPGTIPSPRNNPRPRPQKLTDVGILEAMHKCFGGLDKELNYVSFEANMDKVEVVRTTRIERDGKLQKESKPTPIRRS